MSPSIKQPYLNLLEFQLIPQESKALASHQLETEERKLALVFFLFLKGLEN